MSHYHHAAAYAALMRPTGHEVSQVLGWLRRWTVGPLERAFDPCCGPATWLVPLAMSGIYVAGNDLEPAMVEEARRQLADVTHTAELTQGDMRHLAFTTGPFCAAINVQGSVGHLPDDDAIASHLASVHAQLRPGGVYLCEFPTTVPDDVGVPSDMPVVLDESDWCEVGGHHVRIRYLSERRDPDARKEHILAELTTRDGDEIDVHVHEYALTTRSFDELTALFAACPLEPVGFVRWNEDPVDGWPPEGLGDVVAALRRRTGVTPH